MDLIKIGKEARKTGFRVREGLIRDKYDMEDIDEFFAEGSSIRESIPTALKDTRPSNDYKDSSTDRGSRSQRSDPIPKESPRFTFSSHHDPVKVTSFGSDGDNMLDAHADDFQDITFEDLEKGSSNDDLSQKSFRMKEFTKEMAVGNATSPKQLKTLELRPPTKSSTYEVDAVSEDMAPLERPHKSDSPQASSLEGSPVKFGSRDHSKLTSNVSKDDQFEWDNDNQISDDDDFDNTQDELFEEVAGTHSLLPSPPPESTSLRRSKRTRVKPLDFWRNERIVYTRADEGFISEKDNTLINDLKKIPLQEITEIIHVKDTDPKPKKRKMTRKSQKKGETVKKDESLDPLWFNEGVKEVEVFLDDDTSAKQEVAWTATGVSFRDTGDNDKTEYFLAAPLFRSSKGSISSGLINLPENGYKSLRSSNDMTCIFHVTQGRIEVELNQDRFVVLTGCSFIVPNSNIYSLRNVGQESATLFFVQCRE